MACCSASIHELRSWVSAHDTSKLLSAPALTLRLEIRRSLSLPLAEDVGVTTMSLKGRMCFNLYVTPLPITFLEASAYTDRDRKEETDRKNGNESQKGSPVLRSRCEVR